MTMLIRENNRVATLTGVGTTAAAAFAGLAALQRGHRLSKEDKKGLEKIVRRYGKHERLAELLHPLGKWYVYVPAAFAAGAAVYAKGNGRRRERAAGAGSMLLAAVVSALVNPLFDKVLPQ